MGCEVPFEEPWRGERRLLKMAARAIAECVEGFDRARCEATPLLLCLAETGRCGRVVRDDGRFFTALEDEIGFRFHAQSGVIANGHVSVAAALHRARQLIDSAGVAQVLVAACDSLLVGAALADYERRERLLTSQNSNGFIPGEGAAALLVGPAGRRRTARLPRHWVCEEHATSIPKSPCAPTGWRTPSASLGRRLHGSIVDYRLTDIRGEYAFKEATVALARIDRTKRTEFRLWHPADCIGEVGAAIVPVCSPS